MGQARGSINMESKLLWLSQKTGMALMVELQGILMTLNCLLLFLI